MQYRGSCHCKAVSFTVDVDLANPITCNCSYCQRRGSILAFTPEQNFSLESGKDKLTGGDDADLLHGGGGKDKFILTDVTQSTPDASDTILDFFAGKDRIDLKKIDARPGDKGDDAFRFIGKLDFTGREGELRYEYSKGNTIVKGDTDGDGNADLAIVLTGKIALSADDFVL